MVLFGASLGGVCCIYVECNCPSCVMVGTLCAKADARVLNAVLVGYRLHYFGRLQDASRADVPLVETKKTLADLCVAFGIWKKKKKQRGGLECRCREISGRCCGRIK